MGLTKIELQIEELVLHGFAPEDRHRIAAAVQHELTRLLSVDGLPPGLVGGAGPGGLGAARGRLDAGTVRMATGATPQQVGAQVARAVYGSLGRPANSTR